MHPPARRGPVRRHRPRPVKPDKQVRLHFSLSDEASVALDRMSASNARRKNDMMRAIVTTFTELWTQIEPVARMKLDQLLCQPQLLLSALEPVVGPALAEQEAGDKVKDGLHVSLWPEVAQTIEAMARERERDRAPHLRLMMGAVASCYRHLPPQGQIELDRLLCSTTEMQQALSVALGLAHPGSGVSASPR